MNNYAQQHGVKADASIQLQLKPISALMKEPGVTEIVINEPGVVFYQKHAEWHEFECQAMDFKACYSLAIQVASYTDNSISDENPILSATLPHGERIQIVCPPTVERDTVSVTMRVPNPSSKGMADYQAEGFFDKVVVGSKGMRPGDDVLMELLKKGDFAQFMMQAVLRKRNIAVVGDTGSGKTTFMKMLCQLIPAHERLITIEDVRELFLPNHRNKVHLTYTAEGKARKVTPAVLIKSCMRMFPDRVLPAELRGAEAFDFIDLLTTGHSGSITSWHAENARIAFERGALMCKKHPDAASYTHDELLRLMTMTIDVVCHVERVGNKRFISEIYFDPAKKLAAAGYNGSSALH